MLLMKTSISLENHSEGRAIYSTWGMANLGIRSVRIHPESEDSFSNDEDQLLAENLSEEWLEVLFHKEN